MYWNEEFRILLDFAAENIVFVSRAKGDGKSFDWMRARPSATVKIDFTHRSSSHTLTLLQATTCNYESA
jgi:hypothetical protein